MPKVIIIYSTSDGHTKEICNRLKLILERNNFQVKLVSINDENKINLSEFNKIVIGASIRYGKHNKLVYDFIKRNEQILESKPNAFFSVNLVARKPEKNSAETNPYLRKFLKQISWKPKNIELFAGKLDYQKYRFMDRFMIRLIMWMTKGPTNLNANIEYTDWSKVEVFGNNICIM